MILVRDVFQLQFGKAKEAVGLWKEGLGMMKGQPNAPRTTRLLTDLVGTYYTLVFEHTHDSLTAYEQAMKGHADSPEWRAWYAKVQPLSAGGHREILNVID